jgi:hypothetical protein
MGDMVTVKEERATLSRKEALWKLANELFVALSLPDPKIHEIFVNAPEMTPAGFYNIYACYNLGVARLQEILRQDVYKIEPRNTEGRRKRNIVVHKLFSLSECQKKEIQSELARNDNINASTSQIQNTKRQRRVTSDNEKKLLEDVLKYDIFPEDKAIEILRQLQEQSNNWNMQRIRIYWNNNRHSKKKKVSSDV